MQEATVEQEGKGSLQEPTARFNNFYTQLHLQTKHHKNRKNRQRQAAAASQRAKCDVRHLNRHSAPAAPWQVNEVGSNGDSEVGGNGGDKKKEDAIALGERLQLHKHTK